MGFHHSKESIMIHPRDIATEAEAAVLEHADRLAAIIGKHWHPTNDATRDDIMLLAADLLRSHAIGAWTTQVQVPTAADAVRAASHVDRSAV